MDFKPVWKELPKEGQKVDWIAPGGDQVNGGTYKRLWFLPGGMYVYYEPIAWRPAEERKGD